MTRRRLYIIIYTSLCTACALPAQEKHARDSLMRERREAVMDRIADLTPAYNADSVRVEIEKGPYFSLYRDNYFIGGTTMGDGNKLTAANTNIKFQLSISQRLTRSRLPLDTYLYIHFTQKTIWNILQESLPIYDLNFNPGIGIGHLIIHRNKYAGNAYIMLEHESNGKDGASSRSWNKVSFGGYFLLSKYVDMHLKTWIPIVDSDNNRDILEYNGLAETRFNYIHPNKRFLFSLTSTWRSRSFSFNTQWELSFRMNSNLNQYFFVQYYNGYGEYLLDYNVHKSMLRVGFVIKPQGFNLFNALP